MKFVVDGYNLIATMKSITLSDPEKEKRLAGFINQRTLKKHHYLLVFDGKHQGYPYGSQEAIGCCTLQFTPLQQSADAWIIRFFSRGPAQALLVTNDLAIIKGCKLKKKQKVSCEDFLNMLQKDNSPQLSNEKPLQENHINYWLNTFCERE